MKIKEDMKILKNVRQVCTAVLTETRWLGRWSVFSVQWVAVCNFQWCVGWIFEVEVL
jgi:hypothetical protein